VTYVVAEPCIDILDKTCIEACPVDCIYYDEGTDRMVYIEPNECIDCSACVPVCPVEAIFPEALVPDEWKDFYDINVKWFEDKDGMRSRVNEIHPIGTPPVKPLPGED
jgi:ferredoxin